VYIEDSNNDPKTGIADDVVVDIDFTDGTTPNPTNAAVTRELGDGWYSYDYTDTTGKDFIYVGRDSTTTWKGFPGGLVEIVNEYSTSGSYEHARNTDVQEVFEVTTSSGLKRFKGIWLDLYEITQNLTIRVGKKVNGTDYRYTSYNWVTTDDNLFYIAPFDTTVDVRVTMQSATAETVEAKTVYYIYYIEEP
jgi:hypothetical protein